MDGWEKRFYREREARKEAEKLLEEKSAELYKLNCSLESKVKEKTKELKKLNENLEERINEELKKNKQKEVLLTQQSKMASMGEMLGNIAHQWRQPLSIISTASTGVKLEHQFGTLKDEFLIEAMDGINNAAQYLSDTINDFRDFLKPDKQEMPFNLKECYLKTEALISSKFKNRDIEIIKNLKDITITGLHNELIQVILNILNNARDELERKNEMERRLIFVDIFKNEDHAFLKIKDNAGGIPEDIRDKIFEANFTTKKHIEGTGIGLFMSKEIIESHMNGTLEVVNATFECKNKTYTGAEFTIKLPLV